MASKKLSATIGIGGTVDRSLTRGLTNTKGQLSDVGSAISKAERQQAGLSKQIKTFGRQGRNVDGLREKYAELGGQIDRLRKKQKALNKIQRADVGGKLSSMNREVGKLTKRTATLGTVAAGSIFAVADSTATLGDDVGKTAKKLGVSNEKLQELRYAAERSGVSTDKLDSSMVAFTKRLGDAAEGTGTANQAYEDLGLSAERLADMPVADAMDEVADAMQSVESPTRRNAIAARLFSREGVAMVNMLEDGSEGLKGYAADARRTGYVLGDQAVKDSEKFQDTLLDTQLSLSGLKNIVGAELLPVVGEMMGKFTGWLAENRDQVSEWSSQFADKLEAAVPVIADLASGISTVVSNVGSAVSTTADLVGGFDNLAAIVGTLFAGKALASIVGFAVSVGKVGGALLSVSGVLPAVASGIKAIGLAITANPIGIAIAAIAGAAFLIYKYWDGIAEWFGDLWGSVKSIFSSTADAVGGIVDTAWEGIKTVLSWSPLGLIVRLWNALPISIGGIVDGVKNVAATAWEGIKTVLSWSPLGLIVRIWSALPDSIGGIVDGVKEMAGAAWDRMKAILSWSPIETVTDAWGGLGDWFGGMWDGITEAAKKSLDWISGKLEWVGNAFNKVKGWFGGGDDDEEKSLDSEPAEPPKLGEAQAQANGRGSAAIPDRPQFSVDDAAKRQAQKKEVTQNITNTVTLNVERAAGDDDSGYAQRIAEMVMDEINSQQEGALHDA